MNNEVKEKAVKFASALRGSSPIEKFLKVKKIMEGDEEAQRLVAIFQEKRQELSNKQRDGTLSREDLIEFRELQYEVLSNPIIMEFAEAQEEAFEFCRTIGEELSRLLDVDFNALVASTSVC